MSESLGFRIILGRKKPFRDILAIDKQHNTRRFDHQRRCDQFKARHNKMIDGFQGRIAGHSPMVDQVNEDAAGCDATKGAHQRPEDLKR